MEVITTHINADFDAMASMVAAQKLYPGAVLVLPSAMEPAVRSFLTRPPFPIPSFVKEKEVDPAAVTRLILVDTRQASRLGALEGLLERDDVELHLYDHHPPSEDDLAGDVAVVRPVGATVTLLAELIRERSVPVTPEEATFMMVGLYEDTGGLTFTSTTKEDYDAGGFLLERGADLTKVADILKRELTSEQVAVLNDLILSLAFHRVVGIEVAVAKVSVESYVPEFALLVHKLRDIEDLDVVFAIAQMGSKVYLVGRSRRPQVDVSLVAAAFGGGGHRYAASASIKDLTLIQVEEKLIKVLSEVIRPYHQARHIMNFPVISVSPGQSVMEVAETLNRYSINGMPVMDGERLVGIIGRQMVDRALHLDLGDQEVGLYMNTRFNSVTPEDDLSDIRDYLVRDYQRILPVMEDGRPVGVITRKDLLDTFIQEEERLPESEDETFARGRMRKKSVAAIIRELLPKRVVNLLTEMGAIAQELGMHAYCVGGFVRDLILRRTNLDVDVVVEGDGITFAQAMAARVNARVRHHDKFGTAVVIFPDGFKVDVATARREYYQHPGALPMVESSSLKLDLYRRDFSINTMAIELNPENFGVLVDYFFGQRDLKDQSIRVLHNLSFVEDPTRALRALRFEARFGFKIGKHTGMLMSNAVKQGFLDRVAGRRVFVELRHILEEENPPRIIKRMAEFGLVSAIFPGLVDSKKTASILDEISQVVSWHRLSYLKEEVEVWRIYLIGLIYEMPDYLLEGLREKLELTPRLYEWIASSRKRAKGVRKSLGWARARTPYDIYKAMEGMDTEAVLYLMAMSPERVRRKVSLYLRSLKDTRVELTGKDLIRMGYTPGPIFKEILEGLLKARLNNKVRSLEEEMAYVSGRYPVRAAEESGA